MTERIPEPILENLEKTRAAGVSSAEILEVFAQHGVRFSEATLRKYVQLGLLPRSVRVGQKGKHRGSAGVYPVAVIRQIQRIKDMMAQDYTIEQIQREFLFVRGDIEELERTMRKIFATLRRATAGRKGEVSGRAVLVDLSSAEEMSKALLSKLSVIEQRLTTQARLSKASPRGASRLKVAS